MFKKIKGLESLDGVSISEDSVLDVYKSKMDYEKAGLNSQKALEEKKTQITTQNKTIKQEDEEEYEINTKDTNKIIKVSSHIDEMDENDLQSIIKQNKRHSTISYSQKILKKANNLTKFNKKNNSEGNKHILNSDL